MKREEVEELLLTIAELFPASAPKASDRVFRIWEKSLADISFDVGYRALNRYVINARYAPTISDIIGEANKIEDENKALVDRIRNTFVEICDMWGSKKSKELYDEYSDLIDLNGPDLNKSLRIALDMKEAAIEYIKDKEQVAIENGKEFTEIGNLKNWFEIYNLEVARW